MDDQNQVNHAEDSEVVKQDQLLSGNNNSDQNSPSVQLTDSSSVQPISESVLTTKKSSKKLPLLIIGITVLVLGAIAGTYFLTKYSLRKNMTPALTTADKKTVLSTTEPVTLPKEFTWLSTPRKVEPLPLFKGVAMFIKQSNEQSTATNATYYVIGEGPTNSIYAVDFPVADGPGAGGEQLVVDKTGASFSILLLHSPGFYYKTGAQTAPQYQGPELADGVKLDEKKELTDIKTPVAIKYNGQKFISNSTQGDYSFIDRGIFSASVTEDATTKKIADIPEGTIYEYINKDEADYRVSRFVLLMKHHFAVSLKLDGELSRSDVQPITWTDGSKNSVNFTSGAQGCGGGQNNEIAKITVDQLKQIGKTDGGQKIYGFASNANTLLKKHYDEYAQFKNESYVEEGHKNLTIDQYAAKPEVFLVEDGLGRFLVFESTKTRFGGGCAKPVVYLYPTQPTLVNVSVGADVTLSEPLYQGGWNNVLAQSNGALGYKGKQYDSLYWEGYGKGIYPDIDQGIVVAHKDVVATMRAQLAEQGLNSKESSDFMTFWEAKIPSSPYIRLSWLGTNAMEKLAPLYVSPIPDTRIRVFLDMEGLLQPTIIKPQVLHSSARRGFTIVEWGGLARDGSVPKLR
jgi:hypothetical protein